MDIVYYTVAGIFLYFFSDWILVQIEVRFGRSQYRSLIFFAIIMTLSVSLFNLVQYVQRSGAENPSVSEKTVVDEPGERKVPDIE